MTNLNDVVEKVKQVDDGVNNLIVPLLKDTITDSNAHNKRLFISNIALIIVILVVGISAMILSAYQNNRYVDFLSQFDVKSETVYQSTNDNSDINSGIRIMK